MGAFYQPPDKSDPRELYTCPLCLENVRWRLPVSTRCGHVYCGHCIESALNNFCRQCPVCRNRNLDQPMFSISLLNPRPGTRKGALRRCKCRSKPVKVYDDPVLGRLKNGIIKNTVDVKDKTHYKCPVCLKDVIHGIPMSTECGHVFCEKCIETITQCKICKKDLARDKLIRIYL